MASCSLFVQVLIHFSFLRQICILWEEMIKQLYTYILYIYGSSGFFLIFLIFLGYVVCRFSFQTGLNLQKSPCTSEKKICKCTGQFKLVSLKINWNRKHTKIKRPSFVNQTQCIYKLAGCHSLTAPSWLW